MQIRLSQAFDKKNSEKRIQILFPLFQNESIAYSFYGFDLPEDLLMQRENLTLEPRTQEETHLLEVLRNYVKDSYEYFEEDIKDTENWLLDHRDMLEGYLNSICDATHVFWGDRASILLYVAPINFSAAANGTVYLGIRPPSMLEEYRRVETILHESIHLNLQDMFLYKNFPEEYCDIAEELFVIMATYRIIESVPNKYRKKAQQGTMTLWGEHNLTKEDWELIYPRFCQTETLEEVMELLQEQSVLHIVTRFTYPAITDIGEIKQHIPKHTL